MKENRKSIVIIGAGSRGQGYAESIKEFGINETVVGVAEPDPGKVGRIKKLFPEIRDDMVFKGWEEFILAGKVADAVIIATQDSMHKEPAIACAELGYDILLEKPMATTLRDCKDIVKAVKENGVMFTVCHVLRYTDYFKKLREIIRNRVIGNLVTVQHFEHVGFWHMAHSYVRGNWRNEEESSFMLLTKSCHDIDILRYLIGRKCVRVQSFGGLLHFRKDNKPKEAGDALKCVDCQHEDRCAYSAVKIYVRDHLDKGLKGWPVSVLARKVTRKNIYNALNKGKYGRCVYECDNDVVDHQVVNLEYERGVTASFTMCAFNEGGRETLIQGTHGMIRGNMTKNKIEVTDFFTQETYEVKLETPTNSIHGGGDEALIEEWLKALRTGDSSNLTTGQFESLETHLTTFYAEFSRKRGSVMYL